MNVGEVRVRLNHVHQTIQSECAALDIFPRLRHFEGSFNSSVENGPNTCARIDNRIFRGLVERKEIWLQRIRVRRKQRFSKIARFVVVGRSESCPRHDRQPAEIGIWVAKLMKSVSSDRAVVFETRVLREIAMQIGNTCFAFIKNRPAKKSM